jgi:hypothetical protein
MKAIIRYYPEEEIPEPLRFLTSLPILDMSIHGAPHKRQHRAVIKAYRDELYDLAVRRIADKVDLPIDHPIMLKVLFTNPHSPDLDHTEEALFMALDGKTFTSPSILVDDRHIQKILSEKYYPNSPTKRDGMR